MSIESTDTRQPTPANAAGPAPPAGGRRSADRARRRNAAGHQLIPFSIIDETIQILDTPEAPWSVQLELRVSGQLDPDRLREAVHRGLLRHPLAHARQVPTTASDRVSRWGITDELEVDPLRVVDCPDEAAVAALRADLLSRSVPLTESPPLRLRLARTPGGDYLMANVSHVAFDAFGGLSVLRSIARAYAGVTDDPPPVVDVATTRDVKELFAAKDRHGKWARYAMLFRKLRDLVGAPARLARDHGSDGTGYGFHHIRLTAAQTTALVESERGGTVNDVLIAALAQAIGKWNVAHGIRPRRIGVLVPMNLWPDRPDDLAANFSLPVRVATPRRALVDPQQTLSAVAKQMASIKNKGAGAALIEVLQGPASLPIWAKTIAPAVIWLTGNTLVDTAMVSNIGRMKDLPDFGPDAGVVQEVWFSPPARLPLGLSVGAVTVGGRLHLSLRYRHPQFGPLAITRFGELYVRCLMDYGAPVAEPDGR